MREVVPVIFIEVFS